MLQVKEKNPKIKIAILLFCFFVILSSRPAFAQWGIEFFRGRREFLAAPGGAAGIIVNVVMWMMTMIALLSLGFIVYGAIRYVSSAGEEKAIEHAKRVILYAVIGLVIAIAAVVIIQLVARVMERGEREANGCKVFDDTGKIRWCANKSCQDPNIPNLQLFCIQEGWFCVEAYCPEGTSYQWNDDYTDCVCK